MNAEQRAAYKKGFDLIDWSKPIVIERKSHTPVARSDFPSPMIGGDNLDKPCWGPDGKLHTSKASLRASYKPSGNPMGNSYIEIGNEKLPDPKPRAASDAEIDKSIHKALARAAGA